MDIFLLCRSACCANGHLRVVTPCSTDGGPAAIVLCIDYCVATDHNIFGHATLLLITPHTILRTAASDGRAIMSCSSYFGIVLNGDVFRISSAIITSGSAADTGSGPSAVCRNIGMALDGDIAAFCAIAATDAGSIVPQCVCFYRCIPFDGDIIRGLAAVSANSSSFTDLSSLCPQASGGVCFILCGNGLARIAGLICDGQVSAVLFAQARPILGCTAVQNILAVQLNFGLSGSLNLCCGYSITHAVKLLPCSIRIATGVIHLNIHIAEPDLQHLLGPVIDDPDDVFGGVFGAALYRRISRRGSGGGGSSRRGVGLSGLPGLCRRGGRGAEGGFGGLLLRIRVCRRGVLVHHILLGGLRGVVRRILRGFLCGIISGVLRGILRGVVRGVLALLRVLLCLAQGKGCVRVRLALPGSVRRPGCFQLLRISALTVRDCYLCLFPLNSALLFLGSVLLAGAVLDHDLVAGVGVGLIPLSYFHILLLAVRTRYGLYVNAAVADIVNIRKGRGCNRSNNRHNCCRRQHPQSQIFSLHTKSSLLYIPSLSRSKKDTSFASAWRASRGVVPAFCTSSAQVFSPFYPPPLYLFQ